MTESSFQSPGSESVGFNLWDVLHILRRRWPVMLAVAVCVSFLGIYRTMQKPYTYVATAKLAFNLTSEIKALQGTGRSQWMNQGGPSYLATQMQIIKSEPVAKIVVESLGLVKDPKNIEAVESAASSVKNSIELEILSESNIMILSAFSGRPERAMKIANATAEAYIRYIDDRRYLAYRKSVSGITEQLADLEKKLEDSQKDLIEFIEKEHITNYGDEDSDYFMPRAKKDDTFSSYLDGLTNQKIAKEIEIERLREKYYDEHPKIKIAINDLEILGKKIEEEKSRLLLQKDSREKEIINSKQKEIRYEILKRKVDVNKQLYNTLIRNLKEADIGSEIDTADVEIIEYAKLPGGPFSPNKGREFFMSILLGIMIGVGMGIALHYIDSSFKNSEDLENYLRYPMLSSIPRLKKRGRKHVLLANPRDEDPNIKEAFRLLRTNLRFALVERPGKNIIVTSSQKGEGKSTVTVNLGIVMAEAGSKTLVVDSDLRVRSLIQFFSIGGSKGLSDYLGGKASFDEICIASGVENLFVVPSGPMVKNPALLFESENMKNFIREASERFDYVIFDAPPVGYVVDASIFSVLVDGIIMVVEAEVVGRKTVHEAINRLLKGKANIYGVVFNKEAYTRRSYYYKYYRYYSADGKSRTV